MEEEQEESRESSESLSSKKDNLEETLERKLRVNSGMSRVMKCVGGILKFLVKWYMWLKNKDHED